MAVHRIPLFFRRIPLVMGLIAFLLAAETAYGQRARGGGPRRSQTQTTRAPRETPKSDVLQPGSQKGQIYKFEASEGDDNLIGTLTVRPDTGGRILKLRVRKSETLRISLAGHDFEPEAFNDVFIKGLFCSADWGFVGEQTPPDNKRASTPKELRGLTFETIEVSGKIEAIEGDTIVLKAVPMGDRKWPDIEAKLAANPNAKVPEKAPRKKLKLKMIDAVTTYVDAARFPLALGDFEADQEIQAVIVFGKKQGILVELRSLTAEEREPGEQPSTAQPTGDSGQQRPQTPPPRGGARPRGGRIRAGGGR